MLLKRREPPGIFERIRVALWPRRNLARSARYIVLRLKRLQSSPHRIAVGAAAGVFAVWTPFLGLQLLLAAALSILLRGSIVASFLASFVGNPLTYPVIWFSTYNLGSALLGGRTSLHIVDLQSKAAALWDSVMRLSLDSAAIAVESLWPLFKPMLIGSLPLGGLAAFGAYLGVRKLLLVSNARRARKLMLAHRLT